MSSKTKVSQLIMTPFSNRLNTKCDTLKNVNNASQRNTNINLKQINVAQNLFKRILDKMYPNNMLVATVHNSSHKIVFNKNNKDHAVQDDVENKKNLKTQLMKLMDAVELGIKNKNIDVIKNKLIENKKLMNITKSNSTVDIKARVIRAAAVAEKISTIEEELNDIKKNLQEYEQKHSKLVNDFMKNNFLTPDTLDRLSCIDFKEKKKYSDDIELIKKKKTSLQLQYEKKNFEKISLLKDDLQPISLKESIKKKNFFLNDEKKKHLYSPETHNNKKRETVFEVQDTKKPMSTQNASNNPSPKTWNFENDLCLAYKQKISSYDVVSLKRELFSNKPVKLGLLGKTTASLIFESLKPLVTNIEYKEIEKKYLEIHYPQFAHLNTQSQNKNKNQTQERNYFEQPHSTAHLNTQSQNKKNNQAQERSYFEQSHSTSQFKKPQSQYSSQQNQTPNSTQQAQQNNRFSFKNLFKK